MSTFNYTPTAIDLSRATAPNAIEDLDVEEMLAAFLARFAQEWEAARARNPALPPYTTLEFESDPVRIVGQASVYMRLLDRVRVNDAVRAVLAPLASGANLDAIVARVNIERLVVTPADPQAGTPAVYESDTQLLRRYLYAFDRPSAGSVDRFKLAAVEAWPGLGDVAVNGRAIHGRLGDTDIVIMGPGGRPPTSEERTAVTSAVKHSSVQPEAVAVSVIPSVPIPFEVRLVIEVATGPDREIVRQEALARLLGAVRERTIIGGEIPAGYLSGAAYGPNIIKVRDIAPVAIEPNPYGHPMCQVIALQAEVRA